MITRLILWLTDLGESLEGLEDVLGHIGKNENNLNLNNWEYLYFQVGKFSNKDTLWNAVNGMKRSFEDITFAKPLFPGKQTFLWMLR